MKKFFLLLMSIPQLCHVSYIEKRGGLTRELSGRTKGGEIFLDKLLGVFQKDLKSKPPWYLLGLLSLQETVLLEVEGLPPLPLKRKFSLEKEETILEENVAKYRVDLVLEAKEEMIPLNEEESHINEVLRPFGIQEVKLQGQGEIWFDKSKESIVAEQFVLAGDVIQNDDKKHWQLEWAKGCER